MGRPGQSSLHQIKPDKMLLAVRNETMTSLQTLQSCIAGNVHGVVFLCFFAAKFERKFKTLVLEIIYFTKNQLNKILNKISNMSKIFIIHNASCTSHAVL